MRMRVSARKFFNRVASFPHFDEDVFKRGRGDFETDELVAFGFQMFDERDDGLRRAHGVEHVSAVHLARIGYAF